MIQYFVILLDDTSVSFCHYDNKRIERRLMPLEILKAGILYGMKENLNIQFVYPDYELPKEYGEVIESIDHVKIKPASKHEVADVVVFDGLKNTCNVQIKKDVSYVVRMSKREIFDSYDLVIRLLENTGRLNIVLTDVETFTDDDFKMYDIALSELSKKICQMYVDG